jgi:hypothetical protein
MNVCCFVLFFFIYPISQQGGKVYNQTIYKYNTIKTRKGEKSSSPAAFFLLCICYIYVFLKKKKNSERREKEE